MNLSSRLPYALIGALGGALFGLLLWWVLDFGFHFRWARHNLHFGLLQWVKYSAAICCVLGFLFQDRVGSVLGFGVSEVFGYGADTQSSTDIPTWLVFVVLAAVAVAVAAWSFHWPH